MNIGILGYGNLGRGVEFAVQENSDMELAAVFTRRNPADVKILTENVPVVHVDEIKNWAEKIDVMILCGGSATDLPKQTPEFAKFFWEEFFSVEYYFLKIVSKIFCFLPLKFSLAVGRGLMKFLWIFLPAKRKNLAIENVKICLNVDEKKAAEIAKNSAVNLGEIFMEVLNFPKLKNMMKN